MALSDQIQTISDLENQYYGGRPIGTRFVQEGDLNVAKAAVVTTSTTNVFNPIYGAQMWIQLNMEANAFGVLPKIPWGSSGTRFISARGDSFTNAGIAEDGEIPDSVAPTIKKATYKPKTIAAVFEATEVHDALIANGADDSVLGMADLRAQFMITHKEDINRMLLTEFGTRTDAYFESIDRITASSTERSACGEDDGDEDPWGAAGAVLDRSANTWANAYVNHNSNTVRYLNDNLLQTTLRNVMTNGGQTTIMMTGWDTWASINQLYDPQVRYSVLGNSTIRGSVNGIETVDGIGVGTKISFWNGIPMILSKNTPQDTLSRVYFLDTTDPTGEGKPRLSIKVLKPTQYFEAGSGVDRPLELAKFNTRGAFRTVGELDCTFFAAQAKLRDLQ